MGDLHACMCMHNERPVHLSHGNALCCALKHAVPRHAHSIPVGAMMNMLHAIIIGMCCAWAARTRNMTSPWSTCSPSFSICMQARATTTKKCTLHRASCMLHAHRRTVHCCRPRTRAQLHMQRVLRCVRMHWLTGLPPPPGAEAITVQLILTMHTPCAAWN